MRDVLGAGRRVEYVARLQARRVFDACFAITHLDAAVEHGEHFFAVVHMPSIWLVRPVQADGDSVQIRDVERVPTRGLP